MTDERIDSWKEIAKYLGDKNVRTVQRWAEEKNLPVKRYHGGPKSRVFAYKSELEQWLRGAPAASREGGDDLVATAAGSFERRLLFSYPGEHPKPANAVRLWGAETAYVSCDRLMVEYEHKPYAIPKELQKEAQVRIAYLAREARELNKIFFNGPCARLMRWHHNQTGPAEQDTMSLVFGPIGWFDMEGTNGLIREEHRQEEAYRQFVDLLTIQKGNVESGCRLSNLTWNAVTIFTRDGKVGYQLRGHRVSSVPGLITSTVDENINRYKDEVNKSDPEKRLDPPERPESHKRQENDYRPKGIPHPLAAVRRGIATKVSPRVLEHISPFGIKLTGLAFGLDSLHPDLLWLALADVTEDRFHKLRYEHPGAEADEGRVKFVPATLGSNVTQRVLSHPDWLGAPKGSLIRAIEVIANYKPNARPADVFDILAEAN